MLKYPTNVFAGRRPLVMNDSSRGMVCNEIDYNAAMDH